MSSRSSALLYRRARVLVQWRVAIPLIVCLLLILGVGAYEYVIRNSTAVRYNQATVPALGLTTPSNQESIIPAGRVSTLEVPTSLVLHTQTIDALLASSGEASQQHTPALGLNQPSDMVFLGGRVFVLDTGNGRVVELDETGQAIRAMDASLDPGLALSLPMSMVACGNRLCIADSEAGHIVVFNPSEDKVEKSMAVNAINADEQMPRPIGIAAGVSGELYVSDANNHRILRYQAEGKWDSFVGTGKRAAGDYGLSTPAGLTLDSQGNLYVVDVLNSRVMKYGPDGKFLLQIGRRGDTAGAFGRPKGVAVDDKGNIYVSDSLLAAVQVFDSQGKYSGLIGRKEPGNTSSESLFQSPAEVKILNDRLYVTDRIAGPFVFELRR